MLADDLFGVVLTVIRELSFAITLITLAGFAAFDFVLMLGLRYW